ncbi:hypothetical protein CRV08_05540 [Halarcobacter ebronensis]|uniref:Uncharacterized protein n=1 Tax=Halarcobacter ebronensis TaxID=1462615 RepID=A0A4Q0YEK8_9BACT|nr:tetratricopeptide repeat protein [Halarcobacter ebronensis]RXJ68900.1 hypothetical protein CRV08_05540 [Halarcobacter ebronensis]
MKKIGILLLLCFSLVLAKSSNSMSKKSYDTLIASQKLMETGKDKEAKKNLLELLKTELNGYEKSFVFQTLANIEINANNYKGAIKYYKTIIELNVLEPKSIDNMKLSLAKIYLSENNYKTSIKILTSLLESEFINKIDLYENLAYATYYDKDFKKSILYINSAISSNKEPKESSYQILYSSYVELKEYKNAINTLKFMVNNWHKNETYWLQLIALYQETNELKKALSTFELAYKKGGVAPNKNTLYFVNILIQNELYFKAAQTLEEAMNKGYVENSKKNFDLLISCYDYAKQKDKVKEILAKSDYAKNSKYQLLLANIHFNEQNYKKTIETLEKVSIKQGTKEDGQRNTLLALSYYELNEKNETVKYLQKAINNPHEKTRALNIKKSLQI